MDSYLLLHVTSSASKGYIEVYKWLIIAFSVISIGMKKRVHKRAVKILRVLA